ANQPDGFDCPGCAWGDPEHGSSFEFCENGVKAVSWEATEKRATPAFFAAHTVSELRRQSDYELELNGRLTHPMRYDAASDRYLPVTWQDAFAEIGDILKGFDSPDRAEFYTSGRASNEAAFLYQLFVRAYGTNNFPDCSNMCHEASGVALRQSIGVGKGTVLLEDFEKADAIFVIGQNPGTNHPRMLGDLRRAAVRGAQIVVFNPVKERGLERFSDPQDKLQMLRGGATDIASDYLQPQLGGDMAAVRGMSKAVLAAEAAAVAAGRPSVLDHAFIAEHCEGFDAYLAAVEATSWDEIISQSGLTREAIERAADVYMQAERVICTWAMGITQHLHSVATIREISNFMFLRGNVGKPGAGLCPVRGHSNVQGDRTVGINEKPPAAFLDALEKEFGFAVPRANGHNVIAAIGAMLDGSAQAFIGLGGNFARATPDSALVEQALRKLKLTVHVATKPNHSHLMPGDVSFILPCLGRTEIDLNSAGNSQLVSVEDSMSMVHGSAGINRPASPHLLSEVAIVAGMAASTVGSDMINWAALADDYDLIRKHIEATIPGFEDFNARLRKPRGFHLRNTAAHREWVTPTGKASFSDIALPSETVNQAALKRHDHFALQTFRSHDQYNTTVYGLDDRYRGVYGERQVIFMHPDGYYPELNVLVPIGSAGEESDTPTSKSVMVSVRRREAA
ncbi:MAG: FdhF/YdeP family oxidoreductase, partial [Rhizobiaceae bacterium]